MGLETQLISVRSMYTVSQYYICNVNGSHLIVRWIFSHLYLFILVLQSLSKTVLDIESRLSHAKVLISSLEGLMMSPITPRLSPIPKLFRADKELKIQPSSTPIKDIDEHLMEVDDPKDFSSSFSAPVTTATMITTSHIDEDISDIGQLEIFQTVCRH